MSTDQPDENIYTVWDRPVGNLDEDLESVVAEIGSRIRLVEDEFDSWVHKRVSAMPRAADGDSDLYALDCALGILLRGVHAISRWPRIDIPTREFLRFDWTVQIVTAELNRLRLAEIGAQDPLGVRSKVFEALGMLALAEFRITSIRRSIG